MNTQMKYAAMLLLLATGLGFTQDSDQAEFGERPEKTAAIKKQYEANLKKYKDDPEILVLPGLVADKKAREVRVAIETTGLSNNSAAEYFVVAADSSHGYESIFWAHAKPSDIHKALEFIGMRAGHPINPAKAQFWAKGERVVAIIGDDTANGIRMEELIYDTQKEQPLPTEGFIFTGSVTIRDPDGGKEPIYLADAYDPHSIIPAYNEPASVLDVPWQASKGEFYESHIINPDFSVDAHKLLTLTLEPAVKDGPSRVVDLKLSVSRKEGFQLTTAKEGEQLNDEPSFQAVLKACRELIENDKDLYVSVRFDGQMTLAEIKRVATVLVMADMPTGLRVEPPEEGRLYYRAFVPNPRWRTPENRMSQPWELHLLQQNGELSGTMVMHDEEWLAGESKPKLTRRSYPVKTPQDIRKRLDAETAERKEAKKRQAPAVLLVYVPADVTYNKLLELLKPALSTHNAVHLYLKKGADVQP